jgi:hypothetical protein
LVGSVLRRAVESADDHVLWCWYRTAEELLASPDDELTDAALHELPRAALDNAVHAAESQLRAGPLLTKAIGEYYGDGTWRSETGAAPLT